MKIYIYAAFIMALVVCGATYRIAAEENENVVRGPSRLLLTDEDIVKTGFCQYGVRTIPCAIYRKNGMSFRAYFDFNTRELIDMYLVDKNGRNSAKVKILNSGSGAIGNGKSYSM